MEKDNFKEALVSLMVKDDPEEWKKLLKSNDIKQFVLSLERPVNLSYLHFIREGLEDNLTLKQIKVMENLYPSERQIIKKAFLEKKPEEDIILVAKSGLYEEDMKAICSVMDKGKTKGLIKIFDDCYYARDQREQIIMGIQQDLSINKVKLYAMGNFSANSMGNIRKLLVAGYPVKKVKLLLNENFDTDCIRVLADAIRDDLSYAKLKTMANPDYEFYKMEEIKSCYDLGMSLEQVSKYLELEYYQIEGIMECYTGKYPKGFEKYCINSDFSGDQLGAIKIAYAKGLLDSQIELFAKPKYSAEAMNLMIKYICDGFTEPQLNLIISAAEEPKKMNKIAQAFYKGLGIEAVNEILNSSAKQDIQDKQELLNMISN